MIYPSLDVLLEKVDSKYTLVVMSSKRAREVMNGKTPMVSSSSNKPVTVALEEIASHKIIYKRTKTGIK